MAMKTMTIAEFHAALRAQDLPRERLLFKCPICGTLQSIQNFLDAGVPADQVERYLGFSCIGRWKAAGPHKKGEAAGRGCDWTLGGLLQLHELEVVSDDGRRHPHFEPATPEEVKLHMAQAEAEAG